MPMREGSLALSLGLTRRLTWMAAVLLAAPVGSAQGAERTAGAAPVLQEHGEANADGYSCSTGIVIRWAHVKGIDNYTLTFYDGYYQSEQNLFVSPPYDDKGGEFEELWAPKGMHQKGWTGGVGFGFGSPPPGWSCKADPGYYGRVQNPKVHWTEPGSFIDGTVMGACPPEKPLAGGRCPVQGVKIRAAGRGARSAAKGPNDTTDGFGNYSLKVRPGSYEVTASKGKVKFRPKTKRVNVKKDSAARADFAAQVKRGEGLEVKVKVVGSPLFLEVADTPGQEKSAQTTVEVTVTNKGSTEITDVRVADLKFTWKGNGAAPSPLPLAQAGPPEGDTAATLAGRGSIKATFTLNATDDGKYEIEASATGSDDGDAVDAKGKDALTVRSPPTIAGKVIDSFGDPVPNLQIVAKPKTGPQLSLITDETGFWEFVLKKPFNRGQVVVTPMPLGDQKVTPKSKTVTAVPGKTRFIKFVAELGILRGVVRSLICVPPVQRVRCQERRPRPGSDVEIEGTGVVGKKYDTANEDGEYEFKVPPGTYRVSVNNLTVDGKRGDDICGEDTRIPVFAPDTFKSDPQPVPCAKHLVKFNQENPDSPQNAYAGREIVRVTVVKAKKTPQDFISVPRLFVPELRLFTFPRDPKGIDTLQSGLAGRPSTGMLFGDFESGDYPTLHCRSGCAVIDGRLHNLLGEPVKGFQSTLRADPISPDLGVGLEPHPLFGIGDNIETGTNIEGRACWVRASGKACRQGGPTSNSGRILGLYLAPGIVPGALSATEGAPTAPVEATIHWTVPRQQDYQHQAVTSTKLTIRPTLISKKRRHTLTDVDAKYLTELTNPGGTNTLRAAMKKSRADCEKFANSHLDLIPIPAFKAASKICDVVDKGGKLADLFFEFYDAYSFTTWIFNRFNLPLEGVSGGIGLKKIPKNIEDIKLVSGTEVNTILRDWLVNFRDAHGEGNAIKAGETIVFEIYEVSRLFSGASLEITPQPALFIHLRSPDAAVQTTAVINNGYEPLEWLK